MDRGTDEVLVFEVAGHRLGVPGTCVREIVRAVAVTPLPAAQEFVEGMIDLRGTIVGVLDVRHWLGLATRPVEPSDHFVVLSHGERVVALHVDRALELSRVDTLGKLDDAAGALLNVQVGRSGDGLVLLPEVNALLAHAGGADLRRSVTAMSAGGPA